MIAEKVTSILDKALRKDKKLIPLHEPLFAGNEVHYLNKCIETTFVSSVGKFVERFENSLEDLTGSKHVVAVVNGTCALQMALQVAGVEKGDEVIVPAMSFIATANAVSYCGATPHFVDSEDKSLGICPDALESWLNEATEKSCGYCRNIATGRRIKCLVVMHTFGHPSKIEKLQKIAKDFRLELVEDAAESIGSYYNQKHTGTFGKLGTISFNGNKTITTGGGGAILTDDPELAKRVIHLTTTAKLPHKWEYIHNEIGFNYRMPNINAALGLAQLEQLPKFLKAKRKLFSIYKELFKDLKELTVIEEPSSCNSNYWLQTLKLSKEIINQRDTLLDLTNNEKINTRPVWKLLPTLLPYQSCPCAPLPTAKLLEQQLINLPSSPSLAFT